MSEVPNPFLSERVINLKPSGIRRFFDMANELKGQVLSLSIGEPDFVTPWNIREAGIYSLEQGHTHYTANQGMVDLRQAISEYLEGRFKMYYEPRTEIVVTVGGSEAIDAAIRACVNPGDEVIVPEPSFVAYKACVELAGAIPVPLALRAEDAFKLTPERLKSVISPKTKMLIMAYPNNPTGGVMEKRDLDLLLPIIREYPELVILSDEIYAELTYAPAGFYSLGNYEELRERTIIVSGFSKAFAMTGWRIGYVCAQHEIAEAINKIHQYGIMSAPTTAQYAAIEALRHGGDAVREMQQAYNMRRRLLYNGLIKLGVKVFEPLGAFYMFPYVGDYGISSIEFCERFLKEHKVAIVPGDAFGDCGEGFVRISYASSVETLQEALLRLGEFLEVLKNN
jgi:aminotransferase